VTLGERARHSTSLVAPHCVRNGQKDSALPDLDLGDALLLDHPASRQVGDGECVLIEFTDETGIG
jgi:hypothetical protein